LLPLINMPLTPETLETARKQMLDDGIDQANADLQIADYFSRKLGARSNFSNNYTRLKLKTKDTNAVSAFLDWSAYGTSGPTERFTTQKDQPQEPSLRERFAGGIKAATKGVLGIEVDPTDTLQALGEGVTREAEQLRDATGRLIDAPLSEKGDKLTDVAVTPLAGAAQVAGEVGFEAVGDLASALTPDFIEKPIKSLLGGLGKKFIESDRGQTIVSGLSDVVSAFKKIEEEDPATAQKLDNAMGLLELATFFTGGQGAKRAQQKLAKEAIETTGDVTVKVTKKSTDDVAKLLQPKRTKKELQELFTKQPELVTKSKGGKVLSSKGPLSTADELTRAEDIQRIAPEIANVKKPVDAGPILSKRIAQKGAALDENLVNNPFLLPRTESNAAVKKAVLEAADDFGESRGIFEAEIKRFARFRDKFPGNGGGERKTLIAYDADTKKRYGASIFQKGTARAEAIRVAREASQDTLEAAAKRADIEYLSEIKDMRILFTALDDVATHVSPAIFDSWLKSFTKTPFGRASIQATGVSAGIQLLD